VIKENNSKLALDNTEKVTGWSEFSIVKKFGRNGANVWQAEQYPPEVIISQEGSQEPNTLLIVSNSNAINYGIKNNSNAILNLTYLADFTEEEKAELLEDVRTTSNAFLYCCKNTSNALVYGIKNNSNAIMNFPLTVCGCPSVCCSTPPARTQLLGTDGGIPRYTEDGYSGSASCPVRTHIASWCHENKYLAIVRDVDSREEVCLYAHDNTSEDGLRFVTHVRADQDAHVYSVAWDTHGYYLGIGVERAGVGKEVFAYTFDKETETLKELPGIGAFACSW